MADISLDIIWALLGDVLVMVWTTFIDEFIFVVLLNLFELFIAVIFGLDAQLLFMVFVGIFIFGFTYKYLGVELY